MKAILQSCHSETLNHCCLCQIYSWSVVQSDTHWCVYCHSMQAGRVVGKCVCVLRASSMCGHTSHSISDSFQLSFCLPPCLCPLLSPKESVCLSSLLCAMLSVYDCCLLFYLTDRRCYVVVIPLRKNLPDTYEK